MIDPVFIPEIETCTKFIRLLPWMIVVMMAFEMYSVECRLDAIEKKLGITTETKGEKP